MTYHYFRVPRELFQNGYVRDIIDIWLKISSLFCFAIFWNEKFILVNIKIPFPIY